MSHLSLWSITFCLIILAIIFPPLILVYIILYFMYIHDTDY